MLVNFTQSRESREDVEDVLPAPVSSLEELADLCTKVADKPLKIKLVRINYIIMDINVFGYFKYSLDEGNFVLINSIFWNIHGALIICYRHSICHLQEGTALETQFVGFSTSWGPIVCGHHTAWRDKRGSKPLLIFLFAALLLVSVHHFFSHYWV